MSARLPRFSPSSRARLTAHDLGRFAGPSLFDRIGRALCEAECLPRKELYETWEVARRVRRVSRGGRVIDIGAGHGLLGQLMLLLDDSSPDAVAVDVTVPPSAARVHDALVRAWPRLAGRVRWTGERAAHREPAAHIGPERKARASGARPLVLPSDVVVKPGDVVVSCHACGALTDQVLGVAVSARANVAVLPCCHDADTCDDGGLTGWMDMAMAIDATRAARLRAAGYRVRTQAIPPTVTAKNRLLMGTGLFSTEFDG